MTSGPQDEGAALRRRGGLTDLNGEYVVAEPVKVAFIGAGKMAIEHIKVFADIPECKIVGIQSRTRGKCEALSKAFHIPFIANSITELYEKTKPDLVVVTVNETSMREVCVEAFKFPWNLLIEKPVGIDYDEAEYLAGLAAECNVTVWVAMNRRQHSSLLAVLSELKQESGSRFIQIMDQEDQIGARAYGHPELLVKNWMFANSIHMVDYFAMLGRGEITKVTHVVPWDPENPSVVIAKIAFSSGDVGLYQAIWNAPAPWTVSVSTREKYFELRPLEQATVRAASKRRAEPFPVHEWDMNFKPGFRLQAAETIKAVRGSAHNLANIETALGTMRLINAIYFGK